MKKALILAGAALAFAAAPVAAKPAHAGGHKHKGKDAVERVERDTRGGDRYGTRSDRGCPPGLAKKNNGCMPPGQAKKLAVGQRYASSYSYDRYAWDRLPTDLRRQYDLDPRNRYYYDEGTLYGVDPTTLIVEQVIRAILR